MRLPQGAARYSQRRAFLFPNPHASTMTRRLFVTPFLPVLAMILLAPPMAWSTSEDESFPEDAAADAEEQSEPGPQDDWQSMTLDELGDWMGARAFATRELAQAEIARRLEEDQDDADEIVDFCYQLYSSREDPEVFMRARELLLSAIAGGTMAGRGFVGVMLHLHLFFQGDGEVRHGVLIQQAVAGAPAFEAGIQRGDLIIGIDDMDLNHPDADRAFMEYVASLRPGTPVSILILRGDEEIVVELNLARRPDDHRVDPGPGPEEVFRNWLRERQAENGS